jgi:hypothetical protein
MVDCPRGTQRVAQLVRKWVPMTAGPWTSPGVTAKYRRLLEAVRDAGESIGSGQLTSHWPILGASDRRILVVGQAVFSWIPNWTVSDLRADGGIERILAETQAPCYDRDDPMSWVAENRVRSSPFWRCVRHVVERYFEDGATPWYSHVAWANLYPIAPNDIKGNPAGPLLDVQQPRVAELLDAVVAAVAPAFVLVLAGAYWWGVSPSINLESQLAVERPLFAAGRRSSHPWIVGMHPKGAQLRGWPALEYARIAVHAQAQMEASQGG